MSFRASDRCHWRGNPSSAPAGAETPASLCEGGVTAFGHDGGIVCTGFLPCHSEPVTDVTGVGIRPPRPQARKPPPPSVREVSWPSAMTEGEICRGSAAASSLPCVKAAQCSHWVVLRSVAEMSALRVDGGRDVVRPHSRCSSVGGDAHIAPPFSHHIPGGAEPRPYTPSDVPCERPLPLPLGEVAERSEDGEGKQ